MAKNPRGPAVPIDMTRLPQFAPQPATPSWVWGLASAVVLGMAILALLMLFGRTGKAPENSALPAPQTVTRAAMPALLLPPTPVAPSSVPVSHQIRQPLRVTDKSVAHLDLNKRVRDALGQLGYRPPVDDDLAPLIVRALAQGQSDAFIDAVLNTAHARAAFNLPAALVTEDGKIDTEKLFVALLNAPAG